jgi:rSAM/selenodomain-associated transferase 1
MNGLTRHLVIMAKAPRSGLAKRRLAADIGAVAALRVYRSMLTQLCRRLSSGSAWITWLYVAPDHAAHARRLWPRHPARRVQGRGDLGARMRRPLEELPPGPVVIVGSDIPALERHHIARAFKALGSHDLVFGPASDGGYWLVGARRRPHLPPLFHDVRWSTRHALSDTLRGISGCYRIAMLETLDDLDDGADYRRQLTALRCS